jgi:preprotein translocase subunit SecD
MGEGRTSRRVAALAVVASISVIGTTSCGEEAADSTATTRSSTDHVGSTADGGGSDGAISAIPADAPVDLQFRPVLQDLGPTTDTITGIQEGQVVLADADGATMLLGPALMDGAVFESVRVDKEPAGAYWQVLPVFRPGKDGIDTFNDAAGQCYQGARTCPGISGSPNGRLAMVLDGQVLTAPTIYSSSFERDAVAISGGFSEERAKEIAAALAGESG